MKFLDGSVEQSSFSWDPNTYVDDKIHYPIQGVVLSLRASDNRNNKSAAHRADQRGSRWEAEVLIINDGSGGYGIIPNAVVLPPGASGADNFHEELPRPSTQTLDGSVFDPSMASVDVSKLDGDWCLVQFIGGDLRYPVITHWYPHPFNTADPATAAEADGTLQQYGRLFKRYSGAKFVVTNQGSVVVDTNESNSVVVGTKNGPTRKNTDVGGDVHLNLKSSGTFEVNFNPVVAKPKSEPSLPQVNPPTTVSDEERKDLATRLTADKEFIMALAGRVAQITGNNDQLGPEDTILLGQNPTDHVILGEAFMARFNQVVATLNSLIDAYLAHFHQSGPPTAPTSTPIQTVPPILTPANSISPGVPPEDIYSPAPAGPSIDSAPEMEEIHLSKVIKVE